MDKKQAVLLRRIMERACTPFDPYLWNEWFARYSLDGVEDLKAMGLVEFRQMGAIWDGKNVSWGFYMPTPLADQAVDQGLLDGV